MKEEKELKAEPGLCPGRVQICLPLLLTAKTIAPPPEDFSNLSSGMTRIDLPVITSRITDVKSHGLVEAMCQNLRFSNVFTLLFLILK